MPAARPDVAIYFENLDGGGLQVVQLNVARELAVRGYHVQLIVSEARGALQSAVPPRIDVVELGPASRLATLWTARRLGRGTPAALLAAILRHSDVDASFRNVPALVTHLQRSRPRTLLAAQPSRNLEALLACRLLRDAPRVVVSEHNDLRSGHPLGHGKVGRRLISLQRWLYPAAHGVVAVSRGVAADVVRRARMPSERISVIYNPVVTPDIPRLAAEPVSHPWLIESGPPVILAAGRLGAAKDFPMLIRAFARLRQRRPARLVIIGQDKSERKTARRMARFRGIADEGGIAGEVDFPGFVANPFAWMARASVLAVSSRHEGFCNVIAEALACGCPVVSTDCPSGPAEILDGGRWGRLVAVGDEAAMAEALERTLDEPPDCTALRRRGADFSVAAAVDRYETLLFGPSSGASQAASRPAPAHIGQEEGGPVPDERAESSVS
jgi:glycosyltransferase involved in cell wall biosynthesis